MTGAPGAQVEILKSLNHSKKVVQDSGKNAPINSEIKKSTSDSNLSQEKDVTNKSTYKKYISSDKSITNKTNLVFESPKELSSEFTQFWLFSNLPQVIHAQAPPVQPVKTLHSNSFTGKRGNLRNENSKDSSFRGVCINCIRP